MTVDTAAQKGPGLSDIEGPLPPLKFRNEIKSASPVIEVQRYAPEDIVLRELEDQTIILSPSGKLALVDEQGQQASGFDALNNLTVLDWSVIRKNPSGGRQYTYLTQNNWDSDPSARKIASCPEPLRPFIEAYFQDTTRGGGIPIPDYNFIVGEPGATHQTIIRDNFIILQDAESGYFVAYKTVDEQGQPLEPRNWQRFDNKTKEKQLPADIKETLRFFRDQARQGVKTSRSNSEYSMVTFENKISVVRVVGSSTETVFTDYLGKVDRNICLDPQDLRVAYYCSTSNPTEIFRLDMEGDPTTWKAKPLEIPKTYGKISQLQLDPSGTAFMFETGNEVVLLEKGSLKELVRLRLKKAIFDKQGKIRALDHNGHLMILDPNLQEISQEVERREVARKIQGVDVSSTFAPAQKEAEEDVEMRVNAEALLPARYQLEAQFLSHLHQSTTLEEVNQSTKSLQDLRQQLQATNLTEDQIKFLTQGIAEAIKAKQRVFAKVEADEAIRDLAPRLDPSLVSPANIDELRLISDRLKFLAGFLDDETRRKAATLTYRVDQQIGELFHRQGEEIRIDLNTRLNEIRSRLEKMQNRTELEDWMDLDYPMFREKLALLAHNCPLEAYEVQKQIIEATRETERLVSSYEDKFKSMYKKVREQAAEIVSERTALIASDIEKFTERISARIAEGKFKTREDIDTFITASGAMDLLKNDLADLHKLDQEQAEQLQENLAVQIANLKGEVDRVSRIQEIGTGPRMEPFGNTNFPIWERKVQQAAAKRTFDMVFIPNEGSLRSGSPLDQIQGDVGFKIIDATGRVQTVRLFEGSPFESDWRLGLRNKFGTAVPPTYLTRAEFLKFKKDYEAWNRPNSPLKAEYQQLRSKLLAHLQSRPGVKERRNTPGYEDSVAWREEFDRLNATLNQFRVEHHVMLLDRFDRVKDRQATQTNGRGVVPKWDNHWVADDNTEYYLGKMAQHLDMQLHLQEGLLMLKGHAGTGKDVLVKMFCARTSRLYFGFDCSKWTTDEDLTEVILLDASEGATRTIKIPSAVMNAIQTPGGVLYFNEFNAMPEESQIFLHALFDEKRAITLKTSSGKTVKADSSVLMVASMNPGYRGTTPPEIATRSRFVELEVGYPPLYGKRKAGDPNPTPPYDSSEALRIARSVTSFKDLTRENNMALNEFVQIWDHYINLIDNGAPALTPVQQYDLEVILALVQFSNKLRQEFIQKFEKAPGTKTALDVTLPITGREMRRAAYTLSKIPDQEKIMGTINPEARARNLLDEYFLSHFDKTSEKDKIRTAWVQWTTEKRKP